MTQARNFVEGLLKPAGIGLQGDRSIDIRVHDERLFDRVLRAGSLGFGESYMDAWWDCGVLDEMLTRVFHAKIDQAVARNPSVWLAAIRARLFNLGSTTRAFEVGEKHYDIGNDLYEAMLDSRMVYTCGYWKNASNLEEAQEAKLDLVCKKIGLQKGQRILDIGCGWGSFAKFAAERYGTKVVGVTISKEQVELGRKRCEGLPVEIRLQDYRELDEKFDHIVSLGMFEHVGVKNYRRYMEVVERCLRENGLFLLHTIGQNNSTHYTDPWIEKYIFPNSMLPSVQQIAAASEGLFVMEDWHNFGADYDKTLLAWYYNTEKAWPNLRGKYSERFHRMWRFYLLSCAATFRSRRNQLWQIVFSKNGPPGGYASLR